MKRKPLVSFILPTRDRAPVLQRVLGELRCLAYPFETEIIVGDNDSSDGTVEMVQRGFPDVLLNRFDSNLGAAARNRCMEIARGDYIMMLDDDSYPLGDSVQKAVRVFEDDLEGRIGVIAFNIKRADGSHETAGIYTVFTGCGAMFRSETLRKVGGYPEDYLFYAEEYDLSCRIWQQGMRVVNFRELEVLHLKTGVSRDFNRILEQLVRNNMVLWNKYLPPDRAEEQIRTELWRYRRIGLKEGAEAGFQAGERRGRTDIQVYRQDRSFELDPATADQVLDGPNIRTRVGTLAESKNCKRVLLFNVGKLLHAIIQESAGSGLEVAAIVDDNPFMQGDRFQGIPIDSRKRLTSSDFDAIIIGSASLSLNDQFEKELRALNLRVPILRMCAYDSLDRHLQER
jgi:GT2 family glycosyltransferase